MSLTSNREDSNDSWLDRLVCDIIGPNTRTGRFPKTRASQINQSNGPDRDRHAPVRAWVSSTQAEGSPSKVELDPQPPRTPSTKHYRYNDCRRQPSQRSVERERSPRLSTTSRQTSSRVSQVASVRRSFDRHDLDEQTNRPSTRAVSQQTVTSLERARSSKSIKSKLSVRKTSYTETKSTSAKPYNPQQLPTLTSLGRTKSQQELSQRAHNAENEMFNVSSANALNDIGVNILDTKEEDECIFAPHPGVRPLDCRFISDEADFAPAIGETEHERLSHPTVILILFGVCLSIFIVAIDRNVVTTAIPTITEDFESFNDIGWYGSAYLVTAAVFQPLYVRVYMSFDTRWAFLMAILVFEIGTAVAGASPNSLTLTIARAIQGAGSSGILTGSYHIGTSLVRSQIRPVLFALFGMLYGLGVLAGALIGGALTEYVTWRWAFWMSLIAGIIAFICVSFLPEPRLSSTPPNCPGWVTRILQLDLMGTVLLTGAAIQLFSGLQISEGKGNWSDVQVIGLLCGCCFTTLCFVAWTLREGDSALVPRKIVSKRAVAAHCGAGFFLHGALNIHAYYLPIWFQAIRNDSATVSGVHMIPYLLTSAILALLTAVLVSKNGLFAFPATIGCAIGTIGCGFITTLRQTSSAAQFVGFEILVSAGIGMATPQNFLAMQAVLPPEEVSIGTAIVVASQFLGGAIFVSVGNNILQWYLLNRIDTNRIPDVDLRMIFRQGPTAIRRLVTANELPVVLDLYNQSLQAVFFVALALCGTAFLCSLCIGWKHVKVKARLQTPHNG